MLLFTNYLSFGHFSMKNLCTVGLLFLFISCNTTTKTAQKQKPPNVIIIMTDDQGYGDVACHGNTIIKTPNLDKLHSESVRLTNFHVSPFCDMNGCTSTCTVNITIETIVIPPNLHMVFSRSL